MRVLSILYLFVTFLFAGSLFSENWQDIDKGEKSFTEAKDSTSLNRIPFTSS